MCWHLSLIYLYREAAWNVPVSYFFLNVVISLSLNNFAHNILNDVLKIYGLVGSLKKKERMMLMMIMKQRRRKHSKCPQWTKKTLFASLVAKPEFETYLQMSEKFVRGHFVRLFSWLALLQLTRGHSQAPVFIDPVLKQTHTTNSLLDHFCQWKPSSVQDGIYTLAKAHMHSTPPLRSFPNIAFKTVPMSDWQWPTLILFKEDRLVLPLSMALSSKQSMMWCPWLCARR